MSSSRDPRSPPIRARILGNVDIAIGTRQIAVSEWPRREARALFLLLLATPGHRVHREAVLEALWPDRASSDTARDGLYKAVHALRRVLEPELHKGSSSVYIESTRDTIALIPHPDAFVDADRFDALLHQSHTAADPRGILRTALDLYRGPLCERELDAEWIAGQREALRGRYRRAALRLAQIELDVGNAQAAIGRLEALLADDPFLEDAHTLLIRALLESGAITAAREHKARTQERFRTELGCGLSEETEQLIYHATLTAERPTPGPTAHYLPHSLPSSLNRMIDREDEIGVVLDRIRNGSTRLVTVTGPGGVGKTRIATEAARAALPDFPDGVLFVDLADVERNELMLPAIGAALKIEASAGTSLEDAVCATLRRRPRRLLLLDNLEQLSTAPQVVANLLDEAPQLTILATSRVPLRIRAECLVRIHPLPVPAVEEDNPDLLAANLAVRLFLARAQDWSGLDLACGAVELSKVAEICRRLDGLPLAIELAAARCWDLGLDGLLDQIDDRFALLKQGPVDLHERQRTLEATLEWSCNLLSAEELELFRGMSVFLGGAELETIEAVLGRRGAEQADSLVEQHLAHWEIRDGRKRLGQLETKRAYARKLFDQDVRADSLRRAHAEYFARATSFLGGTRPRGLAQVEAAQRVGREEANINRALHYAFEREDAELALSICAGMGVHWFSRGPHELASRWIDRALTLAGETQSESVAWTALWGAAISWRRGDAAGIECLERRARNVWQALGSVAGLARVDHAIAQRQTLVGSLDEALILHLTNVERFGAIQDLDGLVFSRVGGAHVLERFGRLEEAAELLEAALRVAREGDDLYLQAHALERLPGVLLDLGKLSHAEMSANDAEHVSLLIGARMSRPWVAIVRCWIQWERGNFDRAEDEAKSALAQFREAGDELNDLCGLVACLSAFTSNGAEAEARSAAGELLRRLGDSPPVIELGLGLPALAHFLGRFRTVTDAGLVFAGGLTACHAARLSCIGQRGRFHQAVRNVIAASIPRQPVSPADALERAHEAFRSIVAA